MTKGRILQKWKIDFLLLKSSHLLIQTDAPANTGLLLMTTITVSIHNQMSDHEVRADWLTQYLHDHSNFEDCQKSTRFLS